MQRALWLALLCTLWGLAVCFSRLFPIETAHIAEPEPVFFSSPN